MKQGLIIDENGHKEWYLNDKIHREDGPAVEYANGDKYWWLNDQRHRVDGPALEWTDGTKMWYLNNKLVYSKYNNFLHKYHNLSNPFKLSIIKYRLTI
jgi:hypothetical protein